MNALNYACVNDSPIQVRFGVLTAIADMIPLLTGMFGSYNRAQLHECWSSAAITIVMTTLLSDYPV